MPAPAFDDIRARAFEMGVKSARTRAMRSRRAQGLTAAAKVMDLTDERDYALAKGRVQAWSEEAWGYYDTLGEAKYGGRFKGKALAKLRLYAGYQMNGDDRPVPVQALPSGTLDAASIALATDAVERIAGADGSHYSLLYSFGVNHFVAGDGYFAGYPDEASPSGETWAFYSTDALRPDPNGHEGTWLLYPDPGAAAQLAIPLPPEALVVRIWQQHPRFNLWADSAMRGVLDVCQELHWLTRLSVGTAQSRLNAGVWMLPDTMFPEVDEHEQPGGTDGESRQNPLMEDLVRYFDTAISRPDSAGAAQPYILRADAEDIAVARDSHIQFGREFDKTAIERVKLLRERFAAGVDLPPSIILGVADVNHWNAWQIDESMFNMHVEPDAMEFCAALTAAYYRPALVAAGVDPNDARHLSIWYDETDLVTKPNLGDAADDAWDRLAISDETYRRTKGFNDQDAPSEEEWHARFLFKTGRTVDIVKDVTVNDPAAAAAEGTPAEPGAPPMPSPTESEPAPPPVAVTAAARLSQAERLTKAAAEWAEMDRRLMLRLLTMADAAMRRAVEKAGARLRTKVTKGGGTARDIADRVRNPELAATIGEPLVAALAPVDDLLDGAFEDVGAQYDLHVGRVQARVRQDLARLGVLDDEAAMEQMEERQARDRAAGLAVLLASLAAAAATRLFNPHPSAPALGEVDPTNAVSPGVIRQAMAVAGGAPGTRLLPSGRVSVPPGTLPATVERLFVPTNRTGSALTVGPLVEEEPATGVAQSVSTLESVLVQLPVMRTEFQWIYGDPSSRARPFEPHENLDGLRFASWDAPELRNDESFPSTDYFQPGDHDGCQCDFEVVFLEDSGDPGDDAENEDEADAA